MDPLPGHLLPLLYLPEAGVSSSSAFRHRRGERAVAVHPAQLFTLYATVASPVPDGVSELPQGEEFQFCTGGTLSPGAVDTVFLVNDLPYEREESDVLRYSRISDARRVR